MDRHENNPGCTGKAVNGSFPQPTGSWQVRGGDGFRGYEDLETDSSIVAVIQMASWWEVGAGAAVEWSPGKRPSMARRAGRWETGVKSSVLRETGD